MYFHFFFFARLYLLEDTSTHFRVLTTLYLEKNEKKKRVGGGGMGKHIC